MSNSLPRIMVFVDGTNFLVRLSEELKIPFRADKPPTSTFRYAQRQIKYLCDGTPQFAGFGSLHIKEVTNTATSFGQNYVSANSNPYYFKNEVVEKKGLI